MKDKKTYNIELQTGEKTSHKAVSPYWFAFIPAAAFAILTMYVGISENMASGAILFVSVVIVFLMIFVPISLIIFILRKIISAIEKAKQQKSQPMLEHGRAAMKNSPGAGTPRE